MSSKDDLLAQAVENDANYKERMSLIKSNDAIDAKLGFVRYTGTQEKKGFLINIQSSELVDEQTKVIVSVVDYFFISDMDERFKISYPFRPYFYIATLDGFEFRFSKYVKKKYKQVQVEQMNKEDLDLKDDFSGLKKRYMKLSFTSTVKMMELRNDLMPLVRKNTDRIKKEWTDRGYLARNLGGKGGNPGTSDAQLDGDILNQIVDIREYDVPFHMRVSIDRKIFVGLWYDVTGFGRKEVPTIKRKDLAFFHAKPRVLAFDIETTKLPLKFPDRESDEIMMISYMVDGRGFLIINREIVSADINAFEYTPKAEYKGEFTVWNEKDETALIRKFFDHFLQVRPNIVVTYNGDFFDWPFVEARAKIRGFNMEKEIGFSKDSADEYKSRNCIHMDAFRWVKRDSYLPVGSQNLKAVTKVTLGYDPVEVEPELMCKMAKEQPQQLANYSVSDAVSTYYLYMKYVHQFIFALCTIIPLGADDVLRKGSGTLCEALLMVKAFQRNILFPNKYTGPEETRFSKDGHRMESETYVGGHVEALEAGVFRADIPDRLLLSMNVLEQLKSEVPETLRKELAREFQVSLDQVKNFEQQCAEVEEAFDGLIAVPTRLENLRIYHLDVGTMYPNIISMNRLQQNPTEGDLFFMETIKAFYDRRLEYKDMKKESKERYDKAQAETDIATVATSKLEMVLYESLQLAHKCILNSFYGYVMRKGSRWYSMEMAGIVCQTRANIIKEARKLVDRIGKSFELDTDGIWCLIPASFPETVTFKLKNHKRNQVTVSYPGAMLNALVYEGFTNHQYFTPQKDGSCLNSSENSTLKSKKVIELEKLENMKKKIKVPNMDAFYYFMGDTIRFEFYIEAEGRVNAFDSKEFPRKETFNGFYQSDQVVGFASINYERQVQNRTIYTCEFNTVVEGIYVLSVSIKYGLVFSKTFAVEPRVEVWIESALHGRGLHFALRGADLTDDLIVTCENELIALHPGPPPFPRHPPWEDLGDMIKHGFLPFRLFPRKLSINCRRLQKTYRGKYTLTPVQWQNGMAPELPNFWEMYPSVEQFRFSDEVTYNPVE
ncbi:unnamed protein product [Caenorhabditis nigoni]|uniref:DNA polymerase epsilon catalytic subunit n=1 Tax=Caenorhabditis nigoni TaxID=1611254 RepID=A0A2G5VSW0_9PELO|nr:hypothetical protein B9Z55_003822 [Caenorhabditis nigoni]